MVSADKGAAFNFTLAEESALMRAVALKGAPTIEHPQQDDVHAVSRQRERSPTIEFAQVSDARERFRLHDTLSASWPYR
jgi:hypothetical protein